MSIRLATPADIPAMRAIAARANTSADWTAEAYARVFRKEALPRLALVWEEDQAVVAYMIALCVGSEWELENIAVASDSRRRGLGAQIVGELLGRARDAGTEGVFLEVRESNRAARALYEKLGFIENGRRLSYYCDPAEDAVLYRFCCTQPNPRVNLLNPKDIDRLKQP